MRIHREDGKNKRTLEDQAEMIVRLREKVKQKEVPDADIIDPWSPQISAKERAQIHLDLLAAVYGAGHPGSKGDFDSLLEHQTNGDLLTWIVTYQGQPVGMANCEVLDNGVADLVRTVALPKGSELANGSVYQGQVPNSYVMYSRIIDLLDDPRVKDRIWTIEADLRLAADIQLPSGQVLLSGVRTQHINLQYELKPWLLSVPRYEVHPVGGEAHQEVFLQSRYYLQPEKIDTGPFYLPNHEHNGADKTVSMLEIVQATVRSAWQRPAHIEHRQLKQVSPEVRVEPIGGIHFHRVHLEGAVSRVELEAVIKDALEHTRFVEIIVRNAPENISAHQVLSEMDVVPLGLMPGGNFFFNGKEKQVDSCFHYGIARPDVMRRMVEIEFAKDHHGSPIVDITHRLREAWRKLAK